MRLQDDARWCGWPPAAGSSSAASVAASALGSVWTCEAELGQGAGGGALPGLGGVVVLAAGLLVGLVERAERGRDHAACMLDDSAYGLALPPAQDAGGPLIDPPVGLGRGDLRVEASGRGVVPGLEQAADELGVRRAAVRATRHTDLRWLCSLVRCFWRRA